MLYVYAKLSTINIFIKIKNVYFNYSFGCVRGYGGTNPNAHHAFIRVASCWLLVTCINWKWETRNRKLYNYRIYTVTRNQFFSVFYFKISCWIAKLSAELVSFY